MLHSRIMREFNGFSNMDYRMRRGLTELCNNTEKNKEMIFKFPEDIGEGKSSKIVLNNNLEIYNNDIKCKKSIEIAGKTSGELYMLAICTGEDMEWVEYNSNKYLEMKKGEAILYKVKSIVEACEYKKGSYHAGVTILINPDVFSNYFSQGFLNKNIFKKDYKNFKINKFTLPIESRIIIEQIINCPYKNNIKCMYLESKIMELFSVSLNEIIEKNTNNLDDARISKTEIESLYRAKEILDNSIDMAITIPELSKLIYLNEYKLKTGFKQVFGKPVHRYQLDKRMELAREILQTSNVDIKQVADMVGYANSSSFSKAFNKKYSISPSEYVKNIK